MLSRFNTRIASVLGVSSFVIPEQSFITLILFFIITLQLVISFKNELNKYLLAIPVLLLALGVIFGFLSITLITGLFAAFLLYKSNILLSLVILVLQTSYIESTESLLSNILFEFNLESLAPTILAVFIMIVVNPFHNFRHYFIFFISISLVVLFSEIARSPFELMLMAAIPSIIFYFLIGNSTKKVFSYYQKTTWLLIISLMGVGWLHSLPKSFDDVFVYLGQDKESLAASHFKNYNEVLKFSKINHKLVTNLNEIPRGSFVLVPNLSTMDDKSKIYIESELKQLSNQNEWVVLLVGEHTNMGRNQEIINNLVSRDVLRNDQSVPPDNLDFSGHMKSSDFGVWSKYAILNRGASVQVGSLLDKVLIAGDGWWAEPFVDEWLWVGDYKWQPADRSGRLAMGASFQINKSRWVVLGDSGPFLSEIIVNDKNTLQKILNLSSLWPSFIKDLLVFVVALLMILGAPMFLVLSSGLFMLILSTLFISNTDQGQYVKNFSEYAYSKTNFNSNISKSKTILNSDWELIKYKNYLPDQIPSSGFNQIVFGLVKDEYKLEGNRLFSCKRVGNILFQKLKLMNAQVCSVELGNGSEILIGNKEEASVIRINKEEHSILIVLDKEFLGRNAPESNRLFLEKEIDK